jgi:predicted RNA-binding Zn ribbon-like protein
VVNWANYASLIDAETAASLSDQSPQAFGKALELREAIFQVFSAVGRHQPVPKQALDTLQKHFAQAMAHAHLDDQIGWYFTGADPDRAWWPIAVDAIKLLTTGAHDRIKVCAAEAGCVGLFLDTSKNRSRRWCTMDGCGVDAKVKRQAQRRRSARPRSATE